MNTVHLTGRITKDLELREIPFTKTAVTSFTLAVDKGLSREKKAEMQQKNQPTADFIRIVVYGKQAESCAKYLSKGSMIGISGRIQTGSYENKNGERVFTTDIVANQVEFLDIGNKKEEATGNIAQGFTPESDDIPF